jgi:hypothetical protein
MTGMAGLRDETSRAVVSGADRCASPTPSFAGYGATDKAIFRNITCAKYGHSHILPLAPGVSIGKLTTAACVPQELAVIAHFSRRVSLGHSQ